MPAVDDGTDPVDRPPTLTRSASSTAGSYRRDPRRDTPHKPDAADALVVEAKVVPLADDDTVRCDRQLRVIIGLLRGVLRHADFELPSRSGSDLVSGDCDVLYPRERSGQRCPDHVGSLGRTSAADHAPCRASTTSESEVEGSGERWVTKQQLAGHLGVTARWIEYQQRLGLPYLRMGGMNRYRVSEVEVWLRCRYAAADRDEGR
jgi:hypothetical protein